MALAYDAKRPAGSQAAPAAAPSRPEAPRPGRGPGPNTISASQARAARRREALSNQQAVSAWLRELSGRGR
jgi:hypothetical protein